MCQCSFLQRSAVLSSMAKYVVVWCEQERLFVPSFGTLEGREHVWNKPPALVCHRGTSVVSHHRPNLICMPSLRVGCVAGGKALSQRSRHFFSNRQKMSQFYFSHPCRSPLWSTPGFHTSRAMSLNPILRRHHFLCRRLTLRGGSYAPSRRAAGAQNTNSPTRHKLLQT